MTQISLDRYNIIVYAKHEKDLSKMLLETLRKVAKRHQVKVFVDEALPSTVPVILLNNQDIDMHTLMSISDSS